jgi:very-short-patch-repair endonuclease
MARDPRRPGTPKLRALLEDFATHGMTRTRSDLEAAFLQLCLDHDLPRPDVNRNGDGREVDFTWPGSDLIVEVDSWRHHRHRRAFAVDRAKDREALRAGIRTARFTGDEIEQDPAGVAAELRGFLAGRH